MTDITERLRSIYVSEGTNYVQEARAAFERSRADYESSPDFAANVSEAERLGYRRITLTEQVDTGSADAFTWRGGVWVPMGKNHAG